jgi:hypothetical protein
MGYNAQATFVRVVRQNGFIGCDRWGRFFRHLAIAAHIRPTL